jgi:hypothetical protein
VRGREREEGQMEVGRGERSGPQRMDGPEAARPREKEKKRKGNS